MFGLTILLSFALVLLFIPGLMIWVWCIADVTPRPPREPSPPCCYCDRGGDTVPYCGGFICRSCQQVVAPTGLGRPEPEPTAISPV